MRLWEVGAGVFIIVFALSRGSMEIGLMRREENFNCVIVWYCVNFYEHGTAAVVVDGTRCNLQTNAKLRI